MQGEAFIGRWSRTPFFGREQERALLIEEVERGAGLVTICGPSGIGKTRLAQQLLAAIGPSFEEEGRAWLCPLASSRQVEEVELAVARMLGIPSSIGADLARAIANRGRMLLILDGLDAVASRIGETLVRWLDSWGDLRIVVTSITPIGVEGEVRFSLGPLEPADAVALYLDRARRAWPERHFTTDEEPVVQALVGRLDRIPLAIELAAARVQVLPPVAMMARLGARFDVLRSDAISNNPRSLLQALTSTWELLSDQEQQVIRSASVFEGGFTSDAALAIVEPRHDAGELLDLLVRLRSKALLSIEEAAVPRFELLECVQQFGALELERAGEEEAALLRHAGYFVEQGELRVSLLDGERMTEAIAWLQAERENLLAVVGRMIDRQPSLAARAGLVLSSLRTIDGYSPSSVALLQTTLRAARRSGDPTLQVMALARHGGATLAQGRVPAAEACFEEALRLAEVAGDHAAEAESLIRFAILSWQVGERDRSAALYARAETIAVREKLPLCEAMVLMGRSESANERLDIDEAERLISLAVEIIRSNGFTRYEGVALSRLGVTLAQQGRYREARHALELALLRCRGTTSPWHLATVLSDLGGMELAAGELDAAESRSLEALTILREIGNRNAEAVNLTNLGIGALERGKLRVAESRLLESLGILEEVRAQRTRAETLAFLSIVEARSDRHEQAALTLGDARRILTESGYEKSLAILELVDGIHEVAQARKLRSEDGAAAERLVGRAKGRLASVRSTTLGRGAGVFEVTRLLEQDLQAWVDGNQGAKVVGPGELLRVGPGAVWFEMEGEGRVDLHRRNTLRGLLAALVSERLRSPGAGITPPQLFGAAWPGVKIQEESVRNRVYLGIWNLRNLGLANVLLSQPDGYLLDPAVPVVQEER